MNDNDKFVDVNTDDLEAFDDLLHGRAKEVKPEPEADDSLLEEVENQEDQENVTEDIVNEDDIDPDQEAPEEESPPEPERKPKPKSRFQERISELTAEKRELRDRISELESRLKEEAPVKPSITPVDKAPSPDDKNDNGEDKYPLGEFDPNYFSDLADYKVEQKLKLIEEANDRKRQEETRNRAFEELSTQWDEKLERGRETYPDLDDKNQALLEQFQSVDPKFAETIAETIMGLDYGVDVLYYLADNPAEARNLLSSNLTKAAIGLGRLEARFALHDEEKSKQKKLRVSNAPQPPERLNRGGSVAQPVAGDTDDLEAFEAQFFKRKR